MKVHLNGEARDFVEGSTVLSIVRGLGLEPEWVVVERNLDALDRSLWGGTGVAEGDQIEIVRFMGGG